MDLFIFRQPVVEWVVIIKAVVIPTENEKLRLDCCGNAFMILFSSVLSSDLLNQGPQGQNLSSKVLS